jgi:hypothetical protein
MSKTPVILEPISLLQGGAGMLLSLAGSMVLVSLLPILLLGCFPLGAGTTVTGSGQTVTRQFEFNDFSEVAASSTFQVQITQAAKHSVTVTVDDNILEYLEVIRSGDTLRLGLKPNVSLRNATLKAVVAMPLLTGLKLSGATRTTVAGFSSGEPLHVAVSGASTLQGEIKVGAAWFDVSGASRVQLRGGTKSLKAEVSGASHADLESFTSTETVVEVSGASHATVCPSGDLDAIAGGASSVRYVGKPASVKQNTSGASSVRQK